ncbi:MAG: hypothetical protein H7A04_12155 [Pseudomonadales bacterium]|nr:hypothetical protein [Pseudomonadales bacterium]
MMYRHSFRLLTVLFASLLVTACASHVVKSTTYTPVIQDSEYLPEDLLMDVGISIFDPGLDEIDSGEEDTVNGQIRVAESRYSAYLLSDTLQRSGNWGVVRVLPNGTSPLDVMLNGTILQSDGEAMTIRIQVSDSSGQEWYTKEYHEVISQFSYDPSQRSLADPFQVIYNNIANDLLLYRKENLSDTRVTEIRQISEVLFARRFSPDIFNSYLTEDRDGHYRLTRLPAENDPALARIRTIRERDFMFIDTVQDYYATFSRQMRLPYDSWREQSYYETITLRELQQSARRRFIAGTAAVIGGIAAASSGTYVGQTGGIVGVGSGAYLIKSGFDKRAEAQIHVAALEELGQSLESEVAPKVINLEDRTVTLTGNVEEQYSQWKEILADIYAAEAGLQ